jgi:PAS domain S-box-containing protein
VLDEFSAISRELGQFDADDSLLRMLASLVTASHEFIGIADLEGNALFVNEAGREMVGLPDLEAVRSTRIIDYFSADDRRRIRDEVLPAVRDTEFWEGELKFQNFQTGQLIPVLYNIFPVRDSTGAITAYGTVTRNLIESKSAEQRLRSLASIVESTDDAIVSKNLDGIIANWNRGAERIFGYTSEEAIGQPITMVIPADRQSEEREILTRIRRGERIDHYETVRRRKDGSKRSQEQIATLAREAEHRSKNLLATVQATVRLSQSETPDGLKRAIEGRIQSLANVHSLFVQTRWIGADLSTIATQELAPYSEKNRRHVRIDGPPVVLEPDVAQTVAITLHELATNAAKYGALAVPDGELELQWSHDADGRLNLRWTESNGPKVREPAHKGFGGRVIEQMIAQRSGKMHFDWLADGLVCEITLQV